MELVIELDRGSPEAKSLRRFGWSPVRIVAACEEFPELPWSRIPPPNRIRAMEMVNWKSIERDIGWRKKRRTDTLKPLAKLTTASFQISNWGWTDNELIEQFKVWLKETRRHPPDITLRGRQGSPNDLLSHLGVLRLARHAKAIRGSAQKVEELEMDARNAARAVKKAEAFLANFYA